MTRSDLKIILLVPSILILLPIAGSLTIEGWNWRWNDFLFAWAVFAFATWFFRFLATRPFANRAYKAGAAITVVTGFVIAWITPAVQIIGEDNPGNVLYLLTVLGGFIGVAVTRCRPAGLAWVAFLMAAALLLIPVVAVLNWPADFSPGYTKIQFGSAVLAALFTTSGLLFRRSAHHPPAQTQCS